ncbi:MAG: aminotransferase class I/II-fold pyridoxal phosphate-dependent enzyme [Candidatus Methanoperedens sp.]
MGLLDPGDEVVMSNPYYACYPNFVEYLGGKPVFAYTHEEEGFGLEPEAVAGAMTSSSKAVLINFTMQSHGSCNVSRNHEGHSRDCWQRSCNLG